MCEAMVMQGSGVAVAQVEACTYCLNGSWLACFVLFF